MKPTKKMVRVTPGAPKVKYKPQDFELEAPKGGLNMEDLAKNLNPPKREPANKEISERAKVYYTEFPVLLKDKIASVREFVLTEALPLLTALDSGLLQATSVIKLSLNEEPEYGGFDHMLTRMLTAAIRTRAISFIVEYVGLTPEEAARFLMEDVLANYGNSNDSNIQTLLREVLAISDVPGPTKNHRAARMRSVQAPEGSGQHPGATRGAPNSKRGKR